MTRREQGKRATHARILAVARELFDLDGYERVTIRDIANRAKVSTGAIFGHWPGGKDALFTECMGRRPITDALGAVMLAGIREMEAEYPTFVRAVLAQVRP